jgi:hypothetical protein
MKLQSFGPLLASDVGDFIKRVRQKNHVGCLLVGGHALLRANLA